MGARPTNIVNIEVPPWRFSVREVQIMFGVLISLFFPKFGREDLSKGGLIQKGIAVVLIVAGVILIGDTGAAQ